MIGTLVALHYRERTAAQFIFSTGLVVVILLALAVPSNPLNLLTRLAVGRRPGTVARALRCRRDRHLSRVLTQSTLNGSHGIT